MAGRKKAAGSFAPDYAHSVAVNEYGYYCLPEAYLSREAARILSRGEVYEAETLRFLCRQARRGGDVVSGGAFIGDFLPALSGALQDGAKLHSFEPNPETQKALSYTIALNRLTNVACHPVAVSAMPGKLKLQTADEKGAALAGSSFIVGADATGETVEVDVARLDDLVPKSRKVSVVHLDVENHEIAALSGAERMITSYAPDLVLEAPKPWMRRAIEAHLAEFHADLDYIHTGQIDRNAVYRAVARA